ncbi:hypothetical protein PA25_03600 [Pseudoalteromonas sp. A25]|uniref:pilus assembly FimT family protein n=1 Tax=Pseudoalteromonas sp. A25 TaxID=116092 RepID=UPI0012607B64|nr:type II secretion system protein [Pseudoalteromonas sp. A25]BBN80375.1 hypothetical protein PA25_03600 [Pseudoalteromonas sp. A25]
MIKQGGFTLIELMIVIMIVVILGSFVGPLAFESLTRVQSKAEIKKVERLFLNASQQAFLKNQKVSIDMDNKKFSFWLANNVQNKTQVSFDFISFPKQRIIFNTRGLTTKKTVIVNQNNRAIYVELLELITGNNQYISNARATNE